MSKSLKPPRLVEEVFFEGLESLNDIELPRANIAFDDSFENEKLDIVDSLEFIANYHSTLKPEEVTEKLLKLARRVSEL